VIAALEKLQVASKPTENSDQVSVTEVIDGAAVFGQKWPTEKAETVGVAAALNQAQDYLESNHVITGNVTRVCQKQGCWMILTEGDAFARVDFNDHAFLIPKDSKGSAEVYGRLVEKELSEQERAHYAAEGSGELPAKSYEIIADAVKIIGS
jgi:hypothetical protein